MADDRFLYEESQWNSTQGAAWHGALERMGVESARIKLAQHEGGSAAIIGIRHARDEQSGPTY
jgi:hypothetical protein